MISFFGLMGMTMYYPIFLQGVQGISVMKSGQILTPYSVLVAFIGVPTGFIQAKTKRYKWMYISMPSRSDPIELNAATIVTSLNESLRQLKSKLQHLYVTYL